MVATDERETAMAEKRKTAHTIGRGSILLAEQRFYDETFLRGDDGAVTLFILDAAHVRGSSGRERLRVKRDVLTFPTDTEMATAITDGEWVEGPVEDRDWRPTVDDLVPAERWSASWKR